VEISMEEANSLEVLTPDEESDGIDVEDMSEPEPEPEPEAELAELEEIEEIPASASPASVPWDEPSPEPKREGSKPQARPVEAPVALAEEEAEEELALEPSEELGEEAPVALTEEEPADAPEMSLEELGADAPEMSLEEVGGETSAEPVEAELEEESIMLAEEVVAEAQVARVGEHVVEAPRPPVDLGELPPASEEPMQLVANWEFMEMAEAHSGSSAEALTEERGLELELDTAGSAMPGDTGSPQDELALAPTWDFIPQWQPEEEKSEPTPPSSPPPEFITTDKYGISNAQPAVTGKYGIAGAEPELPEELGLVDEGLERTGLFGVLEPELTDPEVYEGASAGPATTGKYGIGQPGPFEEPGWDQLLSEAEPELPEVSGASPDADPFTVFAAEAERAKSLAPPGPEPKGAAGSTPPHPPGSKNEGSQD
jgi:hypothetical protein